MKLALVFKTTRKMPKNLTWLLHNNAIAFAQVFLSFFLFLSYICTEEAAAAQFSMCRLDSVGEGHICIEVI